jgi:hypothetical protein
MVADLSSITETEVPESFSDTPEDAITESAPASGMTCSVCGKDIGYLYSGKGRKPTKCEEHKKGNASNISSGNTRGSADVRSAVATLGLAYNALGMVLQMAGATGAAATLNASIPGLQEQNATYLAQDRELVKRINSLGKTGGRAAFIGSQVMVLGPVAVLATMELKAKWFPDTEESMSGGEVPPTMGGFPLG